MTAPVAGGGVLAVLDAAIASYDNIRFSRRHCHNADTHDAPHGYVQFNEVMK